MGIGKMIDMSVIGIVLMIQSKEWKCGRSCHWNCFADSHHIVRNGLLFGHSHWSPLIELDIETLQ
jgi:hypothetical protein